jgi:hypothetical protein
MVMPEVFVSPLSTAIPALFVTRMTSPFKEAGSVPTLKSSEISAGGSVKCWSDDGLEETRKPEALADCGRLENRATKMVIREKTT